MNICVGLHVLTFYCNSAHHLCCDFWESGHPDLLGFYAPGQSVLSLCYTGCIAALYLFFCVLHSTLQFSSFFQIYYMCANMSWFLIQNIIQFSWMIISVENDHIDMVDVELCNSLGSKQTLSRCQCMFVLSIVWVDGWAGEAFWHLIKANVWSYCHRLMIVLSAHDSCYTLAGSIARGKRKDSELRLSSCFAIPMGSRFIILALVDNGETLKHLS